MMTEQKVHLPLHYLPTMECNEEELLFELPLHQEETSAFLKMVGGVLTNLQFVKRLMINAFSSEL
jgi:hypothetical protein